MSTISTRERKPHRRGDWRPIFLREFRKTGNATKSAMMAGVHRDTVYKRLERDEKFEQLFRLIEERFTNDLEEEMYRRAVKGVDKPVWQGKEFMGTVKEYSDTLAIFLAKARRPHVYRENVRVEHTGPDGGPIQQVNMNIQLDHGKRVAELLSGADAIDATAVELPPGTQNGNGRAS
jgi:hypothetical protein